MTTNEIKTWLSYWQNGGMVAIDAIQSVEQVYEARKYCSCMRKGVFAEDLVSDLQIWRALSEMRAEDRRAAA